MSLFGKLSDAFGPSGNEEDVAEILRKKHADETRVYEVRRLSRQDSHAAKLEITRPAKQ